MGHNCLHVRFFQLDLDSDLDLRSVDLDLDLKKTWTRTWTCSLKVALDLRIVDLDLDFTVAGLVTSLQFCIKFASYYFADCWRIPTTRLWGVRFTASAPGRRKP